MWNFGLRKKPISNSIGQLPAPRPIPLMVASSKFTPSIIACWVLENAPACFVKRPKIQEGGGCLWDYAATACLFEEAGAAVSDSHGNSLDLNSRDSVFMNQTGVLYASHREIAEELQG